MSPKRKNSLTPQTTSTKKVKSKEGAPDASQNENEKQPAEAAPTQKPVARGRGRPRKNPTVNQQQSIKTDQPTSSLAPANPQPLSSESNLAGQGSQVATSNVPQPTEAPAVDKPRRGRPKKNPELASKGNRQSVKKEQPTKLTQGNDMNAPPAAYYAIQQVVQRPLIKDAATLTDITISNGGQEIDLLLQDNILQKQKIINKPAGDPSSPPKKRGRPKKVAPAEPPASASTKEPVLQPVAIAPAEAGVNVSDNSTVSASPTKGKRGRPRKNPTQEGTSRPKDLKANKEDTVKSTSATAIETQPASTDPAQAGVVKKGRGRPRKNTVESKDANHKPAVTTTKSLPAEGEKPKTKRGRPKKQAPQEEGEKSEKPKDSSKPTQVRRGRPPKRKTPEDAQPDTSAPSQTQMRMEKEPNVPTASGIGTAPPDKLNVKKQRLDSSGAPEGIHDGGKTEKSPEALVHEERLKKLDNMRNRLVV
jgi:hypothetical protein